MLLSAVIVPPLTVLQAVADVVQSADRPVGAAAVAAAGPRRGFLTRLGGRGARAADPPDGAAHELDLIPTHQLNLPVTAFGNVTTLDAREVAEALKEAAITWDPPTVRFAGGAAPESPDDRSVWAKLDGDVAAMTAVAKGVTQSVEALGFFVDRRKFRPSLSVATITERTAALHLNRVVEALDAFRGEPWTLEYVSLVKRSFVDGSPRPVEVYRIPIGPH